MEKTNKNFLKVESDTQITLNAEREKLELTSKLSGVVLYHLLRVKEPITLRAANGLKNSLKSYSRTYSNACKLYPVTDNIVDYALVIDRIRSELGVKTVQANSCTVAIDNNAFLDSIMGEIGENSQLLSEVLMRVSRNAYGKMETKDTVNMAKKIITATGTLSDIHGFTEALEKILATEKAVVGAMESFVESYAFFKRNIQEISVRSIMQKIIGDVPEEILRMASSITSQHLEREYAPSWPKVILEKSIYGPYYGMAMHFKSTSSYFAIVYIEPKNYNLIANFVVSLKDTISDIESSAMPGRAAPKLTIATYSDIGVCMVGSSHFDPSMEGEVRNNIQRLLGRK
jgi:hypothetical protein